MKRVAVTGIGMYSPLGCTQDAVWNKLLSKTNATCEYEELYNYRNMNCKMAAMVTDPLPELPRKKSRGLGRIGKLAVAATQDALHDSGLADDPVIHEAKTGIAYGSCGGTMTGLNDTAGFAVYKDTTYLNATSYVQIMPHSAAVSLSIFFGIHGRLIATSTACTSGSQAVGYAYETIKNNLAEIMIAGGAEELNPFTVGVFDALFATSSGSNPKNSPRPFDKTRDGIIVAEGAGTLILEDYERALARGAHIYAEVVGFSTNCDAVHITNPSTEQMENCMRQALANADLTPDDIDYINAHGTGTHAGDAAEGSATFRVFGNRPAVSTLKSYMGHTLGAAGALEAEMSILMASRGWLAPNLGLTDPDPECGMLNFITGDGISMKPKYIMSNNFAFGGVNTSLIFKMPDQK
jgi:3-oxoacyl-[acyl-carrier-protein] synthase II